MQGLSKIFVFAVLIILLSSTVLSALTISGPAVGSGGKKAGSTPPPAPAKIEGDLDNDGDVDFDDFLLLADQFGKSGSADFDKSGKVDNDDFLTFSDNFGTGTRQSSVAVVDPCAGVSCREIVCQTNKGCTNGRCVYENMRNGVSPCDGSSNKWCQGGSCIDKPPADPCAGVNCNDGNSCTDDSCNGGRCSNVPKSCNDGNPCTDDSCSNGACSYITKNCGEGNECRDGNCVRKSRAVAASVTSRVDIPVTLDLNCELICTQRKGKEAGVCSSDLYENSLRDNIRIRNFLVLNNQNCPSGTSCYCYNPSEQERIVLVVRRNLGVNEQCTTNENCESGFCTNGKCVEGCSSFNMEQCRVENRCSWLGPINQLGGVCVNRAGNQKLLNLMPGFLSGHASDKVQALKDVAKIIGDYRINYGEYSNALMRQSRKLGVTINLPIFNLLKVTGRVVNLNTRINGCPDFDSNKKVDFDDFLYFADSFGRVVDASIKKFDLAEDEYNVIGFDDFLTFADNFGNDVICYYPNQEYTKSKKEGLCDANGICSFKFNVKAKYPGEGDKLKVLMGNDTEKITKEITINFAEGSELVGEQGLMASVSVIKDVTSSTVKDITGNAVNENTQQRSRFECGLRINPEICCPSGYIPSSDNSRCVVIPVAEEIIPAEKVVSAGACADFNKDNEVNFVDFFMFKDNFGDTAAYNSLYDFDSNGKVDFDDFLLFADEFGKEPSCG